MQRKIDTLSDGFSESQDANHAENQPSVSPDSSSSPSQTVTSRPSSKWLSYVLWGGALAMSAIASATLGTLIALTVPLPESWLPESSSASPSLTDLLKKGVRHRITRPVNILVMGIDRVPEAEPGSEEMFAGRSDTMLLVQVNPVDQTVSLLSIPRDTQVEFPGRRGVSKINHANVIGGPRLAADVIQYNLGDVQIDRYLRFSTSVFRDLVDQLGGVEVFVPQDMQYVDRTQNLNIDLKEGLQVLSGNQAEQFARFRNDAHGDIGRVQRQQVLIRALRDRIASPTVIPKIPQIIELLQSNLDTNLTPEEMLALATFSLEVESEDLRMVMLPGRFSQQQEYVASYWIMDPENVGRVMEEYFGVSSLTYASSSSRSRLDATRSFNNLRIAVQNASSYPQMASQVASHLRDQGFNNVYTIQDWPAEQYETQIIVQQGHLQGASMLESMLGLGSVVPSSTGDLGSDLTIRVGDDWLERPDLEL